MSPPRTICVFLASPGDLAVKRRASNQNPKRQRGAEPPLAPDVIDLLNLGFGDGANVRFIPLGWVDTLATAGRPGADKC